MLLLCPLDNSVRNTQNTQCGYVSSKSEAIRGKNNQGQIIYLGGGGTGAEKVWNKDGRKEGQEMCSRIMQAYEEG